RRQLARCMVGVTMAVAAALGAGPLQAIQGSATGPLDSATHPHYFAAPGITGAIDSFVRGCVGDLIGAETCMGIGTPLSSAGGAIEAKPSVYIVFWGWNGVDPAG